MNALMAVRLALAGAFAYQGLVPKLLGPHPDELAMVAATGLGAQASVLLSRAFGVAEIGLAVALLALPRQRWPYMVVLLLMPLLLLYVAWATPNLLAAAFNPVSTNLAIAALAYVGLAELRRQSNTVGNRNPDTHETGT